MSMYVIEMCDDQCQYDNFAVGVRNELVEWSRVELSGMEWS